MSALTVGTSVAVQVSLRGAHQPIIQNLGPGTVYVEDEANVSTATGLQIPVGVAYEFPRAFDTSRDRTLYLISSQAATDVRVMVVL